MDEAVEDGAGERRIADHVAPVIDGHLAGDDGGSLLVASSIIVREYVVENLATDDAVLVIDETGFLKQGKTSCGLARQYTGSVGKITNC